VSTATYYGCFDSEISYRRVRLPRRRWWLRWLPRRRVYTVRDPLTYTAPFLDGEVKYTIPADFETDFASVPFGIRLILGPMFGLLSEYERAAALHDYLYRLGLVSRQQADRYFYLAMFCDDVFYPTRVAMWAAVRSFGWAPYNRYRRLEAAGKRTAPP
jgi:hypothetical protein